MGFIATKEEEEEEEDAPQQENQQQQYFHVLAVDDNISDRKLLERLLQVSSYQVTCVDSGDKALEYLGLLDSHPNGTASSFSSSSSSPSRNQVSKVNMIMTDYCMPGMSGYDLLKRVKGSSWKHVPVVIMSSDNVPSRISMCLEGGADEFLLKPVQISDLERLQTHLLKSLACSHHDDDDGKHGGDGGGKRMAAMPPNARHKMKGSQPNNND